MAFLVLIGPMASGKSKIGRRLAKLSGKSFIDTDKEIVKKHGEIATMFVEQGEAYFRDREVEAVREALLHNDAIVSLGGGAPMRSETIQILQGEPVVLLTMSDRAAEFRLRLSSKRPLLKDEGFAAWKRITNGRMPTYRSLAQHTVDTSLGKLETLAQEILSWREEEYVEK